MYRTFVFPSCNEPGLEIINSLTKSNKIMLFGGSSYDVEFDPSRLVLKNHVQCPDFYDEDFKNKFHKILENNQIDIVFPTMDILVAEFSKWHLPNTIFITPDSNTAELLLSKVQTYERLKNIIPVPKIYTDDDIEFPAYAKPNKGSGSRGHIHITNEVEQAIASKRGLLVCEYLPGQEYTVDCISDRDGQLLFSNVRIRGQIGRGIALGTRCVSYPKIEEHIKNIAHELRIEGPWFAQFKEDKNGQPKLMEINARIGGSSALTRLAGVNIPLMSVFVYMGSEVEVPKLKPNILLNRSLRNLGETEPFRWAIWDLDDTILRRDGKPDPEVVACLYDYNNRGVKQILMTKNSRVGELLQLNKIPDFFVEIRLASDKLVELEGLMQIHGIEEKDCVLINDSYTENLAIQKLFSTIRILTPDTLDLLGKEKL